MKEILGDGKCPECNSQITILIENVQDQLLGKEQAISDYTVTTEKLAKLIQEDTEVGFSDEEKRQRLMEIVPQGDMQIEKSRVRYLEKEREQYCKFPPIYFNNRTFLESYHLTPEDMLPKNPERWQQHYADLITKNKASIIELVRNGRDIISFLCKNCGYSKCGG